MDNCAALWVTVVIGLCRDCNWTWIVTNPQQGKAQIWKEVSSPVGQSSKRTNDQDQDTRNLSMRWTPTEYVWMHTRREKKKKLISPNFTYYFCNHCSLTFSLCSQAPISKGHGRRKKKATSTTSHYISIFLPPSPLSSSLLFPPSDRDWRGAPIYSKTQVSLSPLRAGSRNAAAPALSLITISIPRCDPVVSAGVRGCCQNITGHADLNCERNPLGVVTVPLAGAGKKALTHYHVLTVAPTWRGGACWGGRLQSVWSRVETVHVIKKRSV